MDLFTDRGTSVDAAHPIARGERYETEDQATARSVWPDVIFERQRKQKEDLCSVNVAGDCSSAKPSMT